jgi:intracellular sulfur oxidation DsrE/DsrF family protein
MKNDFLKHSTHRRGFIGTLAAGAATLGLSLLSRPLAKAEALGGTGEANPADLEAWFAKVNGKHRMVFDATHPHEVFPFAWPKVFLMTNEKTGTPPSECNAIVVLRHSAIGYALQNSMWEKYPIGEVMEANDHLTKAPAKRNPFWQPKAGDFKVPGIGEVQIGINELQSQGVMFCVCEMAMTVYSSVIGDKMKMDPAQIRAEWMASLLPGVQPVPSGVWALGRAQEHGCGYCFTG